MEEDGIGRTINNTEDTLEPIFNEFPYTYRFK